MKVYQSHETLVLECDENKYNSGILVAYNASNSFTFAIEPRR